MKAGTLIHPSRLAAVLANPAQGKVLLPLVEECVAHGAAHIELTGEVFTLAPPPLRRRLAVEIRDTLAAYRRRAGISFSVHLPSMGGLDISSSVQGIRTAAVKTFAALAEITAPLEPESYILHVAGMIHEIAGMNLLGKAGPPLRRILQDHTRRSLDRMAGFMDPEKICIENLPAFSMEWLASFVEEGPESVCLDVGHLTLRGESLDAFLVRFAGRVREVHLHDVEPRHLAANFLSQVDHAALGEGVLDIEGILHTLRDHRFQGPVVLEVLRGDGLSSLDRLNRLLQAAGENP